MLKVCSMASVKIFTVRSLPEWGMMPWLAMELRPGQGERTSSGPGGAQWLKSTAETNERREAMDRTVGSNILGSIFRIRG